MQGYKSKANMRTTKRMYLAYAVEDRYYRDLLNGQSLNMCSRFEYTDMPVKEPRHSVWKERCRTQIKGCNGIIAMLSRNSLRATIRKEEIACDKQEGIPLTGVYMHAPTS